MRYMTVNHNDRSKYDKCCYYYYDDCDDCDDCDYCSNVYTLIELSQPTNHIFISLEIHQGLLRKHSKQWV